MSTCALALCSPTRCSNEKMLTTKLQQCRQNLLSWVVVATCSCNTVVTPRPLPPLCQDNNTILNNQHTGTSHQCCGRKAAVAVLPKNYDETFWPCTATHWKITISPNLPSQDFAKALLSNSFFCWLLNAQQEHARFRLLLVDSELDHPHLHWARLLSIPLVASCRIATARPAVFIYRASLTFIPVIGVVAIVVSTTFPV